MSTDGAKTTLPEPPLVAHVIGGGDTGGAMTYVLALTAALRSEDCDARVVCLGDGGLADEAARRGLPVEVIPMRGPWDPRALLPLRRLLSSGGWDVVHTHGMRANLPVRMILRFARRRPALFTTIHSELALDYSGALRPRVYGLLDRVSAVAVDGFFCVSHGLAARLSARGVPHARIHVVYAGIEPPAEAVAGVETVAGAEGVEPVVGTVARLVAVKDLGLLLQAARVVAQRVPGVRMVVVGDGPEREALQQEAVAAGLGEVVEFRGAVCDVWPVLRGLQVYVLSSVSEGVPLAVLEAMSVGIPVVATAVGGLPEIVSDGVEGYLVERTDRASTAERLAERITALLADADMRERMGAAAKARVLGSFSPSVAAGATLGVYRDVLAARHDHGGK